MQKVTCVQGCGSGSGMEKRSGIGINILDHISELKIIEFFVADSYSGIRCLFDPGSGIEKSGCNINMPDPQHCVCALKIWEDTIMNVDSQVLVRSPPNALSAKCL